MNEACAWLSLAPDDISSSYAYMLFGMCCSERLMALLGMSHTLRLSCCSRCRDTPSLWTSAWLQMGAGCRRSPSMTTLPSSRRLFTLQVLCML